MTRFWGILALLGAVLFVLWVARAVYVSAIRGGPWAWPVDPDASCRDTGFSCGVLSGAITTVLTIAFAAGIFLLLRFWRVKRRYLGLARTEAEELLQAGGSPFAEIVGRDELCRVLMADLRDRNGRRPHVVVGGVGTGKTAVLVRLTQMLARDGAVPVPIRLRGADSRLDFRDLAHKRFVNSAQGVLLSDADAEKVWRQLSKQDRIVVLADGLEEALTAGSAEAERDSLIRVAIREAAQTNLPLVIASRPHDPLRGMDAAVVELEPLSEEAALKYVQAEVRGDDRRIDWIIETADVVETPLYLRIMRQLHEADLLGRVVAGTDEQGLDTRGMDRVELRLRLMQTWLRALERGNFAKELPLNKRDRKAAIAQLSGLACIGLEHDSLDVKFAEFVGTPPPAKAGQPTATDPPTGETTRAGESGSSDGDERTLLERLRAQRKRGAPARPHRKLYDEVETTVKNARWSGIDVRLAATMGLRLGIVEAHGDGVRFPHSIMQAYLGSRMMGVALQEDEFCAKALDSPGREFLVSLVLHACDEAARPAADEGTTNGGVPRKQLAEVLGGWGAEEGREAKALDLFAAALEIDSIDGGSQQRVIADDLTEKWKRISKADRTVEEAKLGTVRRLGDAARKVAKHPDKNPPAYSALFEIGCLEERSYRVRLAAAQELGAGSDRAFEALGDVLGAPKPDAANVQTSERRRQETMRAWLAPMLVGSVTSKDNRDEARRQLGEWLTLVGDQPGQGKPLPLALEVALAQGFKHAANRRRRHPHARDETREHLAEQAREMLTRARFWFSRLTLVHALCLWALPDDPAGNTAKARRRADFDKLVRHWLSLPAGHPEHPFVTEARALAVLALETGRPERYIWIDESGVVTRVGSLPTKRTEPRKHQLWIPPSTGWTALDRRAQQLVADVLLLLNLAERGDTPDERDRRLDRANRSDLPPCLKGKRTPLDPSRTVGDAESSAPGSTCIEDCPFQLCPYPPKGDETFRVEVSEAFCRRQQTLVHRLPLPSGAAPWQNAMPGELRRFWASMGERARR
jgi:hypothetical protein